MLLVDDEVRMPTSALAYVVDASPAGPVVIAERSTEEHVRRGTAIEPVDARHCQQSARPAAREHVDETSTRVGAPPSSRSSELSGAVFERSEANIFM